MVSSRSFGRTRTIHGGAQAGDCARM
jgi:hypothetical protein